MRLLYTTNVDLSRSSAQRTHVVEIVNGLASEGYEIHLTALKKRPIPQLHENVELHELIPIINRVPFSLATRFIQKVHSRHLVKSIMIKKNIDVAYERQGCDLALPLGKMLGIPVIMEINGLPSTELTYATNIEERERIDLEWLNSFKDADRIVTVTSGIKNELVRMGINESKISVVTNGVNTNIFHPLTQEECRRLIGIPQDSNVAIFVGNFRPYHNLEILIRSIRAVVQRIPNFLLLLVGDSIGENKTVHHPTIEELKSIAVSEGVESHVRFIGRVDQTRLPIIINSADIGLSLCQKSYCSTDTTEHLSPIKTYEYLACGVPIISSNMNELNPDEKKVGFATDIQTDSVAKAISDLLINAELRHEMGENAVLLVNDKYSWKHKSDDISKMITEMLK